MNKDYNRKKKLVILTLAIMAVCMTAGLIHHVGNLAYASRMTETVESVPETETEVNVPEIETEPQGTGAARETEKEPEQQEETIETGMADMESAAPVSAEESTVSVKESTQKKPSDGKPKSPSEAVMPSETPAESVQTDSAQETVPVENPDADGICQPEHTPESQPQGGETNGTGGIYVPGFGYVESSGPNVGHTIDSNGDWNKQVGTMN